MSPAQKIQQTDLQEIALIKVRRGAMELVPHDCRIDSRIGIGSLQKGAVYPPVRTNDPAVEDKMDKPVDSSASRSADIVRPINRTRASIEPGSCEYECAMNASTERQYSPNSKL